VLGLADAAAFINENPEQAAEILAPTFNLDEETTLKYLTWPGMNYTTTPYGLMGFAPFMKQAGYIEKVPQELGEIAWSNVLAAVGHAAGEKSPIEKLQERP
jgi:NitT/TauT family transport system substrate-binding protein